MRDEALSAACESERSSLLRMARRHVGSPDDAEDVVAEAIARAHEASSVKNDALGPWLNVVTRRLCVDVARDHARWPKRIAYEARRELDGTEDLERLLDQAEAKWLYSKVHDLPERQRQALLLKADGHSVAQVAEQLGVAYRVADGLLQRARATMRSVLAAAGAVIAALVALGRKSRLVGVAPLAAASSALLLMPNMAIQQPKLTVVPAVHAADPRLAIAPREAIAPPVQTGPATLGEPTRARADVPAKRTAEDQPPMPPLVPHERTSTRLDVGPIIVHDHGATRERPDEDFLASVQHCISNRPVVTTEHLGCR